MTTTTEFLLNNIAVRLTTKILVAGQVRPDVHGSGVIYYTTKDCGYMYVFTALHCVLGRRTHSAEGNTYEYAIKDVDHVLVEHNPNLDSSAFKSEKVAVAEIIVDSQNDFCILKVEKMLVSHIPNFPEIVIHSNKRKEGTFRSAGFLSSNDRKNLTFINFNYAGASPDKMLVVTTQGGIDGEDATAKIGGYSGSGLMMKKVPVLCGLVTKLNDETAFAGNVHVKDLSYLPINELLNTHDSTNEKIRYTSDAHHIIINEDGDLIDLSKVEVNGVKLNIWKAVGNIRKDLADDWFQDPLRFKDILYSADIYKLIKANLANGKYQPKDPELYAIPKEGFTTRKAVQTAFLDRVIYQAAVDHLANELDNKVISSHVYSVRYNYNVTNNHDYFFFHTVEQWRKFQYQIHDTINPAMPYLVATDITNFYDNIAAHSLQTALTEHRINVSDKSAYDSACAIVIEQIRKWQSNTGPLSDGIPQNREPSAFLANLLLANVDKQMIADFPHYYRYMDDIRITCKDKFEARRALMFLIDKLSEIGLNLNSQKTKILNYNDGADRGKIEEYTPALDKEIEQICSLMDSGKSREVQISVIMVNKMFHESLSDIHDLTKRKKFKFAIERLQRFSRTPLLKDLINFSEIVKAIIERFEDNPWYSEIYTRFLLTVDRQYITNDLLAILIPLVINASKNIYTWQSYLILKLLAFHQVADTELQQFAQKIINHSQGVEKAPVVAGACLYLASVDTTSINLIKSSFNRGYFQSHLSKRCALICLQSIAPGDLNNSYLDAVDKEIHLKAYNKFTEFGKQSFVYGLPKLKVNQISRDLPQIISLL
ncbi:RNA-directed DNA polymerase [Mucilaginibacter sp. KACC 22773]|uniref:RNA-directed DNA polymerase n=1 Tax=Mucilaginibacter sp. KACC 22773 TaxID=3025671 RepID=UPI00236653E3|nr:RNA-directed DNA polymerase [Mucilaginibacter sp. KACC 22773]WDF78964.1 RNA-directed DNA polymerase [Mucilaginibacter sp. KACC 22773]